MPQKTDLNINPYYDDFDQAKQFYRWLYRPSVAVQARELTGMQSMLQNQIERFGSWAFRNGDIVSGCAISDIPSMPFCRLADFQANGASYAAVDLANTQVVCNTSNLQARVIYANGGFTSSYPDTNIIYLQYLNTGTNGESTFAANDTLTFYKIPRTGNVSVDLLATVNAYSNVTANTLTIGNGHGISVSEGVVFLSGCFVLVQNPTIGIVQNFEQDAANNVVGFQAVETIVTENEDESLADNALGYPNENAPGAHRLKIVPTLIALDQADAANTAGFNPIAIYNYGALVSHAEAAVNVYSLLGDAIERRTYEESGNYVVNPFQADTVTSITGNSIISSMDANNVLGRISPGLGYAMGSRVELLKTAYINMRRGIDTQSVESQQITFNYGQYFICDEVAGDFDFTTAANVTLYDSYQSAITNRVFSALTPTGNNIGTAKLRCFSYNSGVPGTANAQYLLHLFNIQLANGYATSAIKSVYYGGTVKGVADVISNGSIASSNKDQLYSFGVSGLKNLRDAANNNNGEYVYRTRKTGTMATNGDITITLSSSATGGTDILPYGVGVLPDLEAMTFNLSATANVDTANLAGTVTCYSVNTLVTGSSTTFTTDFVTGSIIKVGSDIRVVSSITNATSMLVDAAFSGNASANTYKRSFIQGEVLPISVSLNPNKISYISVSNTTSFTIKTNLAPSSSLGVDVVYDVLRTSVSPAMKTIKKNRFVKINTATTPKGPWCLGVSDVHKLTKVYGASSNTYSTSGSDLTANFILDTGQRDTHYDLAYLYAKPGVDTTSLPYLLVQLDYFTANTSGGLGFFTVESYPIDDVNASNVNAIQTKDIPLYIDEAGQKSWLRDYVDFRTPCTATANDTGAVDTSNSSAVTAAIGYATYNPSNTLTLTVPVGGLNVPSYGRNFESDYTHYLPRKDLVMITNEGVLKIKEGVSSVAPQTPLFPDSAMPIAVYNIPAYPSLSTDQLDSLYTINKTVRNPIRDTSTAVSTSLVQHRRYTMRDIGKLDQRITNVEYYMGLSLLEKKAADLVVTDADGLDRFKNGIFVDPMSNFELSEVSNPEFSVAIDASRGVARPRIVREVVLIEPAGSFGTVNNTANTGGRNFYVDSTNKVQKTGRCITLPYNEVQFMQQPFATKYRSSALVAYAWNGRVILVPSYDNHGDTINTGSINITIDNTTAWKEFANGPMGAVWGDWRTTSSSVSSTVTTGTQDRFTWTGSVFARGYDDALQNILGQIHQQYGPDVVIGDITLNPL